MNRPKVAMSWSGGKDACLALDQLMKRQHDVACLVSMMSATDGRNHAHGIPLDFLQMQADAIGLPLVMFDSAGRYEAALIEGLAASKERYGLGAIAFGTLYVEADRRWNEHVAAQAGLEAIFPLWIKKEDAASLLDRWLASGYEAILCRAKAELFDPSIIGKRLDAQLKAELINRNICPMGEGGEYHSFVVDGPIFRERLDIVHAATVLNAGLWSLDIQSMQTSPKERRF